MLENLSENMTKEKIEQAEKDIKSLKGMLKGLSEWQKDWEKFGVDMTQIDSMAKADFGIVGEKVFLRERGNKLAQFNQELEKAEEMVRISKEKLEKKKSDEEKEMCGNCCGTGLKSKSIFGGLSSILAECDECGGSGKVPKRK